LGAGEPHHGRAVDGQLHEHPEQLLDLVPAWLIGTYISDSGLIDASKKFKTDGTPGSIDGTKDHVKLLAVNGDPNGNVPEPSSAALLGIAALGFWRLRRIS
jgi:PEP-CTERM motif